MWRRRELLGAIAGGTAAIGLVGELARAQTQTPGGTKHEHGPIMKACCDACDECAKACNRAFHHCLAQAALGKTIHAKMAQMVADCAAFCTLSAEMISRESSLMALSCRACADACQRCAGMRGGRCRCRNEDLYRELRAL